MSDFFNKDKYNFVDVENLINNCAEESINLEFKSAGALARSDDKRREISKDVSAFANSAGGIIIYGINEKNHKADSFSFINGDEFSKEWLEQVINSGIQRHIDRLSIFPIRKEGDIAKTIYLVKIPYSYSTPHISKDKRYYKRFNFESVAMEEYEVRQLYDRKGKSKLSIASYMVSNVKSNDEDSLMYKFTVDILNEGTIVEEMYKVNLYIYLDNLENIENYGAIGCQWDKHIDHRNYQITLIDKGIKISYKGSFPVFPDELINAMQVNILLPKNKITEIIDRTTFKVVLLYLNGDDEIIIPSKWFTPNDLMLYSTEQ